LSIGREIPIFLALAAIVVGAAPALGQREGYGAPPKAGPVDILPLDAVKPGMRAVAWTTFRGTTPEPVPVEILGRMHNAWGPGQDVILAKLGGPAQRTNVAGGMSGSPVYFDGKLLGAIALRFSTFSPDAIAGITPIELMLGINELDRSRPLGAAALRRRLRRLRGDEGRRPGRAALAPRADLREQASDSDLDADRQGPQPCRAGLRGLR